MGYLISRRIIAPIGGAMFIKQRIAIVEWAEDHENLFEDRAIIVFALYFLGAIIFGVAAWKAVLIGAAAYGLVLMRIGARPIAVLGVLFFLVAAIGWTGLGDIRRCFKG
jgi:O-antigen ligase